MIADDLLIQESTEKDDLSPLGPYQATYAGPPPNRAALWLVGGAGLLLVLLVSGWAAWMTYGAYTQYGPAAAFFWGLPWLAAALVLWILWLAVFSSRLRPTWLKVDVYKNGLVIFRRRPFAFRPRRQLVLWDHVSGVAVASHSRRPDRLSHRLWLFLKPEKVVGLWEEPSGIAGLPELISRIKVNVYMRLLPAYRTGLQDGRSVPFGPVSISKSELVLRRQGKVHTLPWSQVRQVNAQGGDLVVELTTPDGSQPVYRFPVSKIPNIELLFQLIREDIEA